MREKATLRWGDRQRDLYLRVCKSHSSLIGMSSINLLVVPSRWCIGGQEPERVLRAKHRLVHAKQYRKDDLHRVDRDSCRMLL